MSPRSRAWILAGLGGSVLFLYGVSVGKYRWPPHDALQALMHMVPGERQVERESLESEAQVRRNRWADRKRAVEPGTLITLRTLEDVERRRSALAERIWGSEGLPLSKHAAVIDVDSGHPAFSGQEEVRRVDRVIVEMDKGLRSVAYLFNPGRGARFVLYHEGHDGDIRYGRRTILRLLREGYSVMAFAMPLLGENGAPRISDSLLGPLDLETHDQLGHLDRPLRYFLEPVCVGINHLQETYGANGVDMIGFSGGGWTTTVYAALDPRVRASFPVAGTLPLHLRTGPEWGDFEQHAPDLVEVAGYLDLYVMGATGAGRRQLQVLHRNDPTCFAGDSAKTYAGVVATVVSAIGAGTWELHLDEVGREHALTPRDLDQILIRMSGR